MPVDRCPKYPCDELEACDCRGPDTALSRVRARIAQRAVERGRALTPQEQLTNLAAALAADRENSDMKLITAYKWRNRTIEHDIATAFDMSCDSDCDDRAEQTREIVKAATRKLGELLQLLHEKGVLNDEDVLTFLSGFEKKETE